MMIYQNFAFRKLEDANLPAGTVGLPHTIISAKEIKKGYWNREDILSLTFKESGNNGNGYAMYSLIGESLINLFMQNSGVKEKGIEGLVNKEILAFIEPEEDTPIRGISIIN